MTEIKDQNTEIWALHKPGFIGSSKQFLNCGKCGNFLDGGLHQTLNVGDMFKPTMHILCDGCFESLPAQQETRTDG